LIIDAVNLIFFFPCITRKGGLSSRCNTR